MTLAMDVQKLTKVFYGKSGLFSGPPPQVQAVKDVSFEVAQGETLGIVGESGCGKSTLARMLVGLLSPTEGRIAIAGRDLADNAGRDPAEFGRRIQYVFQDPISSLNPRKTIRQIIEAPLKLLHNMPKAKRDARIAEIFDAVNLRHEFLTRYPHEFSGGQAQRIGIARALAAAPAILILDEPVSALDVSVQAQVLNLLAQLKDDFNLTYLFISHDLAVVEAVSNRVAVLYFGRIVEIGQADRIFSAPKHHYTRLLADSAPVVGRALTAPEKANTELPDPFNPPPGCAFADRCPAATDICRTEVPPLRRMTAGHDAACHHPIGQ
ncbi:ABC transporter ATP-binding protein [Qingshengfaniella alkalisoli]|uniref:ATP-binding cassette domain-containing protein n=1 Tax=Qingshengfaniella alkalisoli TaxID=2599296 RepID=A0A5B8IYV0_9RHOB|nr:oligopeptide/dipeptide ABC transporter ATP-binding protein [Qingshengfaniella alkalisoli]QDY70753.1 ATP-binding cassette domain-containing protein [Qingshengfaniella alkalisoli]